MASPTYVGGNTQDSVGATSLTFTIPGGAATGDLILVLVKQSENTGAQIWDDDGGGGRDYIQSHYHRSTGGRDQETAIYWKLHTGSETNPTFTWWSGGTISPMSGIMLVYTNVDSITPIADDAWMWAESTMQPPNPGVETDAANNRVVVFHCSTHDDISSAGAPSGYTLRDYVYGGPPDNHTADHRDCFSADAEIDTIGSYTPGNWTHGYANNTPEYHTYTIALREPMAIGISNVNGDGQIDLLETGCTVTGYGFGTSQGVNGMVEIWSDLIGTIKEEQTVTTWTSDTSITFTAVQGSLNEGSNYLIVTNNSLEASIPYKINLGALPFNPASLTGADLYWTMDGDYDDTGVQGENASFDDVQRGSFSFATTPINRGNIKSWYVPNETGGSEPPSSSYTNITNTHTYRNIGGWVRIDEYQKTPAVIYEEGGGVNNIYFLMLPSGWLVGNVSDSGGSPDFKYECYSDFPLIIERPYYIHLAMEFGDHFVMYIDGVLQTTAGGGDLGTDTTMSTHSGDWSFGDPGANLDTGGVDISYNAASPMYLAHWGTWSGVGGGAPLASGIIINNLFRDGALPEHKIYTNSGSAMQTAIEAYDSQTHADWPLTYDIQNEETQQDLTLTITDQVWPDECKFHVYWESSGNLTIRNSGTSNFDLAKAYSPISGAINIIETAGIKTTVKDISDSSLVAGARVFVNADSGGPLDEGENIINGLTDASGEISAEIDYTTSQPIIGYVRSASGSTKYKQSDIVASVGAVGTDLTIFLIRDE